MGVTGQALLVACVAGEVDPERLSHLARWKPVKKQAQLQAALPGKLTPHHRVVLEALLQLSARLDRSIARFDREIAERLRPHDARIARIDQDAGLGFRNFLRCFYPIFTRLSSPGIHLYRLCSFMEQRGQAIVG